MKTTRTTRINRTQLVKLLSAAARKFDIEIVHETGSTNADLIMRWRKAHHFTQPIVRIAYSQTAGRGRRGRVWLTPTDSALLFSVAYLIPRALNDLVGLSLATGVAIIQGLRALPLIEPQRLALKWPNDVLLDHAKLAGVLVETAWHTAQASAVVIGVGINLDREDALVAQLNAYSNTHSVNHVCIYPPAALARVLPQVAITSVFASVLNALARMLEHFSIEGFAPFHDAWNADHAYKDRHVVLTEHGNEIARGTALRVDELGRLLIDVPPIQAFTGGDLSLRSCV